MTITHADDLATFRTEVLGSDVPVVVDFWAEWCGPCRMIAPILDELAADFGDAIRIVKVNVDLNQSAAHEYGVQSIPMIGLFENGDMTKAAVGARPRDAIVDALGLERFRNAATATAEPRRDVTETVTAKVEIDESGRY